jgi:hypothetical protein
MEPKRGANNTGEAPFIPVTWDMYAQEARTPSYTMDRKRAPTKNDQALIAPITWDTYARNPGNCNQSRSTPVFRDISDQSVSLSYVSTVPDYVLAESHNAGLESMARMPSPVKVNERTIKKPRYTVSLSVVMAAQEAAQKTFLSYLESKVIDLESVEPSDRDGSTYNYEDMVAGNHEGWNTMGVACRRGQVAGSVYTTNNKASEVYESCPKQHQQRIPLSQPVDDERIQVYESCPKQRQRRIPLSQLADDKQIHDHAPAKVPESFCALAGKEVFLSSIQANQFSAALLEHRVDNMCFFVEEPYESFERLNTGGKLDNLGPFAMDRWKHMKAIHCIFPNRHGQAYFARQLACTHYQGMFSSFVDAIEAGCHEIDVQLYYPVRDYVNNFLVVWNEPESVREFSEAIDWSYVGRTLNNTMDNNRLKLGQTQRQARRFKDYGYTSGVCTSRKNSASGVSKPILKPGTIMPPIIDIFLTGSKMVQAANLPWLDDVVSSGYEDPDHPTRHEAFSKLIHPNNIIEACRLHGSTPEAMCGAHSDNHNSLKLPMALVVGINKIVRGERLGITYYSRTSADAFLDASVQLDAFTRFVLDTYRGFHIERRGISNRLLEGDVSKGLFQVEVITNPCNLDPSGFHQSTLFLMCSLSKRLSLTLPEMVSVVAAYELIPDNPYYFYLSIRSILSSSKQVALGEMHRGYAIGYLVGSLMLEYHRIKKNQAIQVPGRRFPTYVQPKLPTGQEWRQRCDEKIFLILHINSTYPTLTSKVTRQKVYRDILKRFAKNVVNMGELKTNHSLAIMASLGLLPCWIREHAEITADSRYMKWFATQYPLPTPLNPTKLERVVSTLRKAFETEFGRPFTIRELENILCKVFRVTKEASSDRQFCDMLIPYQNLFSFEVKKHGTKVTIMNPGDEERILVDGNGLINRWMLGDSHLTMQEIVKVLGIPAQMPTDESMTNITLPRLLCDGRWDGGDEMVLTDDILLESERHLTSVFKRISSQLRN